MERLSNSPPGTPKTTPPGQAEKATKPGVLRTRSSGNGQAGEQSFESRNSTIDLTSSPEAPKQVTRKKRFPMVPASLMFDVLCLSAS